MRLCKDSISNLIFSGRAFLHGFLTGIDFIHIVSVLNAIKIGDSFVTGESNVSVSHRSGILVRSLENKFSKICTGEQDMVKGFLYMELHFSGCKAPCPLLNPVLEEGQLGVQ